MDQRSDERSTDEAELAALDEKIRLAQGEINTAHLNLLASADVIVDRLRQNIDKIKGIATSLAELGAPWAEANAKRLFAAIHEAEITRADREGKVLLARPEGTEDAIEEWLREMRLGATNSESLIDANRYGLARLRALLSTADDVASNLATWGDERAQSYAARLNKVLAKCSGR